MPILAREADLYPEDLLDDQGVEQEASGTWWALYTLPRHEKELMRRLRGLEIAFYAPVVTRRKRSPAGRVRVAHLPLFPSYVFMQGDEDSRYRALTTNCISRWLAVPDGPGLVRDLRQIRCLIETGAPLNPEARLAPGMRVRVRSGPLAGIEGVLIKRRDEDHLLVSVNFLKQGASVLLQDYELERLE